jgi:tetratricopeptide (TPR) repeat protein
LSLKRTNLYLFFALCTIVVFYSCKNQQGAAEPRSSKESGEVEPDQLRPEVDTRFQEKFFQAQLEKAKGNTQSAYNLFQECIKIESLSAAAHYEVGKIDLIALNNTAAAMVHAKVCVEQDKLNPWYHQLMGDVLMAQAKYDQAVKSYREVARLNESDPNVLYQIATAQLYAGKQADAIATYNELEKQTGPYEELSIQKHKLYLELKDTEKAGKELESLARAFPEEPRYWGMVAQFYQSIGNTEKAEFALNELLKSDPDNGQVHFELSEYYAAKGDNKRSYEELRLAFQTTDVSIDQKMMILIRYLTLTDFKKEALIEAYELLDLTDKLHPREARVHSIYGDFLHRDGRNDEALMRYKKAAELDPAHRLIWEQVLMLESELMDFTTMEKDSRKAMELFPNIPEFYYYNGLANQRLNAYAKAAESYAIGKELVVENDLLLARFYASLGEVYHYQNLHDKSDEAYEEALRLEPENVFVLNNYAYYLCLRKKNLEKAAAMSKKSNELSPGLSSFEDTYAWILYHQGKYTEALSWIELSLQHGEENGELLEHEGDILFKLGRTQDAVARWKKASQLGGASDKILQKIEQQKIIE